MGLLTSLSAWPHLLPKCCEEDKEAEEVASSLGGTILSSLGCQCPAVAGVSSGRFCRSSPPTAPLAPTLGLPQGTSHGLLPLGQWQKGSSAAASQFP